MTLPFIDKPRDAHQSLADIELQIPPCMATFEIPGSMRVLFSTPIPSHVDVRPAKQMACKLLRDLDQWALAYPHLASISGSPCRTPAPMEKGTSKTTSPGSSTSKSSNAFVALIASNYTADRLVV